MHPDDDAAKIPRPTVTPRALYDLIYSIAPDMRLTRVELEGLLCAADDITSIGLDDLHALAYKLAEKGLLDEHDLTHYLDAADRIRQSKR
jgi:hypothetical protein